MLPEGVNVTLLQGLHEGSRNAFPLGKEERDILASFR